MNKSELSDVELRALRIVLERDGCLRASHIGWELWKDTTPVPRRGEGSHGANKFARAAGKILNRLERNGYLDSGTDGAGITWRTRSKTRRLFERE